MLAFLSTRDPVEAEQVKKMHNNEYNLVSHVSKSFDLFSVLENMVEAI